MSQFPVEFWSRENVPPIPLLQQLNDWAIKQNEKRMPKWKFKFADDLAMQIQPQLTRANAALFEGAALVMDHPTADFFITPKLLRGRSYRQIRFQLIVSEQDPTIALTCCGSRQWRDYVCE